MSLRRRSLWLAALLIAVTACTEGRPEVTSTSAPPVVVRTQPQLTPLPDPATVTVTWPLDEPFPVAEVRERLAAAAVPAVLAPPEVPDQRGTATFRIANLSRDDEVRWDVKTIVRGADGELRATVNLLVGSSCPDGATAIDVRGQEGCVIQEAPVAMVEWQEAGLSFRAEGPAPLESLVAAIGSFVLVQP